MAWHQDSMRVNDEIETSPRPRLSIKVFFFVRDMSEPGRRQHAVEPGSHVHDEVDVPEDGHSSRRNVSTRAVREQAAVTTRSSMRE